ncbi:unnamed protein product [Lota lota]
MVEPGSIAQCTHWDRSYVYFLFAARRERKTGRITGPRVLWCRRDVAGGGGDGAQTSGQDDSECEEREWAAGMAASEAKASASPVSQECLGRSQDGEQASRES